MFSCAITRQTGKRKLHLAVEIGDVQQTELLIEFGAAVNVQDNDGNTPLHLGAIKSAVVPTTLGCINALLKADADTSVKNKVRNVLFISQAVTQLMKKISTHEPAKFCAQAGKKAVDLVRTIAARRAIRAQDQVTLAPTPDSVRRVHLSTSAHLASRSLSMKSTESLHIRNIAEDSSASSSPRQSTGACSSMQYHSR